MTQPKLDRWLEELPDGSAQPPGDMRAAVLARLDASEGGGPEDDWLFEADETSVAELLGADVADALGTRSAAEWTGFTEAVMARLDAAVEPGLDPLRPDAGVSIESLLRSETASELARMEGRWLAFRTQILHQVGTAAGSSLDQQAVDLLRADVDDEVHAMSPVFEGPFEAGVDRRLRTPEAPSWWSRLKSRLSLPVWSAGFGLAGAAAALLFALEGPGTPDPVGVPVEAEASVSVDSVSFDGDIMVVPDGEVTIVILSEV